MRSGLSRSAAFWVAPLGAMLSLTIAGQPLQAQRYQTAPCPPPVYCPPPSTQFPSTMPGAPPSMMPAPQPAPSQAPTAAPTPSVLPQQQQPDAAQAPSITPEQTAAGGGGESFAAAAPNVIGDGGATGIGAVIVSTGQASSSANAALGAAVAARISAFKVTENQTPRPVDRVYFGYNYFNNVNNINRDVHRESFGFERTFLDGNASFGASMPVFQVGGGDAMNLQGFGNLNLIGKYAWINDTPTGNLLSTGMVLTLPTGRGIQILGQSDINDVIFQPWLGFIWNRGNIYAQGFSAIAVPTDIRDITILFNDVAVGYWIYRNPEGSGVTGVIPTIEAHINTPLNHRGLNTSTPFGMQDSVVFTFGNHVVLNQRSLLTVGVAAPVTGPQPFDVEAIAQFNYRF